MFNKLKKTMTKKTTKKEAPKKESKCANSQETFAETLENLIKKQYGYTEAPRSTILLAQNDKKGVCFAWGDNDDYVAMTSSFLKHLPPDCKQSILTIALTDLSAEEYAAVDIVVKSLRTAKKLHDIANKVVKDAKSQKSNKKAKKK